MIIKLNKINYKIIGLEFFGLIITTRKQLENCEVTVFAEKVT